MEAGRLVLRCALPRWSQVMIRCVLPGASGLANRLRGHGGVKARYLRQSVRVAGLSAGSRSPAAMHRARWR